MIISASRRTDIPAFYSEWFMNRIKEGFVLVRNPVNIHQISRISLSPDVVDCIVFWSKNPGPMLERLDRLKDYAFYFQLTITPYDKDVEQNLPSKSSGIMETFKRLSEQTGTDRVIWRYDPVFLNARYTPEYHLRCFEKIAGQLKGYTETCTVSFMDYYTKIMKNIEPLRITPLDAKQKRELAKGFKEIASGFGMKMNTCAEDIELSDLGISHARCIDDGLIERITGSPLAVRKDCGQRAACGCVESIDIGAYDTCLNGCRYCYASNGSRCIRTNFLKYNVKSPLLCSMLTEEDVVKVRKVKPLRENQLRLKL